MVRPTCVTGCTSFDPGQGVLVQTDGDYPLLKLNDGSWEVMRGQRQVRLIQMVRRKKGERPVKSKADEVSWEGVDSGLFEGACAS